MRKDALAITVSTLVMGSFGMFLRWLQRSSIFDAETGLTAGGAPITIIFVVYSLLAAAGMAGLVRFWLSRYRAPQNDAEALRTDSPVPFILSWVLCALFAAGGLRLMFTAGSVSYTGIQRIFGALTILCGACIPFLTHRGEGKPGMARLPVTAVTLYFCCWVAFCYLQNYQNPVTWSFLPEILAIIGALLAVYYVCGWSYRWSRFNPAIFWAQLGAYLNICTITDSRSILMSGTFIATAALLLMLEYILIRMGLFDWFRRLFRRDDWDEEDDDEEEQEVLAEFSGLRVEALDEDGGLMFVAKLAIGSGTSGELQLIGSYAEQAEEATAQENAEAAQTGEDADAPEETKPKPRHIQLRGYDEHLQKAIHLEGDATPFAGRVWRVRNLALMGKDNDRAFFRQDVDAPGEAVPIRGGTGPAPCKVLNLSAGGACIQTSAAYEMGERLRLSFRIGQGSDMSVFCTVCRVSQRKENLFEYGCSFEHLDPAMEDAISRALLQLQMKRIKR